MKIEELKVYQKDIIRFLLNAKKENKLVHAYLFEGTNGSGTIEAAKYFAMMQLCNEEEPCLKCQTCEKVRYNSHINVVLIEPIDNMIRKDQIEYLMRDFNKTSMNDQSLIYIIKDADKMNTASENALLKILEEPAPGHYAILTTENKNNILNTIISRCQVLHFNSLTNEYIEQLLIENKVDSSFAKVISNYIYNIDESLNISTDQKYIDRYNIICKIITNLLNKKDAYTDYFLNKEMFDTIEEHQFFFMTMLVIFKELLKIKNNKEQSSYFESIIKNVNLNKITYEDIYKKIEIIMEYQKRLGSYPNMSLLYSAFFAKINE